MLQSFGARAITATTALAHDPTISTCCGLRLAHFPTRFCYLTAKVWGQLELQDTITTWWIAIGPLGAR